MLHKDYWSQKKILVAGAGKSGLSAARLLSHIGARVEVVDDTQKQYEKLSQKSVDSNEIIILSPGIPLKHPVITYARDQAKPIYNEIDIAVTFLPDCKFVGITGTNGKSTTTAMLGSIAQLAEPTAFVGGNLGIPLCDAVMNGKSPKLAILELSSFQLEVLSQLSLDVAVITNLAPDHLDHYASVEDYFAAKMRILKLLKENGAVITKLPRPTQWGKGWGEGQGDAANILSKILSPLTIDPSPHDVGRGEKFKGPHNRENLLNAILAAQALGISSTHITSALQTYQPLPHRMEYVGELKGVQWFNDSKGTNVHAASASVKGFEQGLHLIVGGIAKESDFASLTESCRGRVKNIYTIGRDGHILGEALKTVASIIPSETLENAVVNALKNVSAGDTILLSPACSSYDQFKDFNHRGETFKALFQQFLTQEQQQ